MILLNDLLHKIRPIHVFIFFVLLHVFLFNINAAEWGDSYRILRASEYLRYDFVYPSDEKRPPLYSLVLSVRPTQVDPVVWGRGIMFVASVLSFLVFYRLLQHFFPNDKNTQILALLLFALNPVYLYWSLRVMADVFFSLLVLAAIYYFEKNNKAQRYFNCAILGILAGLAILTRFEGYILMGALGLGIWLENKFAVRNAFTLLKKNFVDLVIYLLSVSGVLLPYLVYRNPFNSSYFEEPGGREYNLDTIVIYLLSFLFLFGFVPAFYFFYAKRKEIAEFLLNHIVIASFLFVELLLILVWPAAIPRIFVPVIPLLILLLAPGIVNYFRDERKSVSSVAIYLVLAILFVSYVAGQYYYKLQFLVLIKPIFLLVILLSLLQIYSIYTKKFRFFVFSVVLSMFMWSLATIYIHKDIFVVVKDANLYVTENLRGTVGFNDISSVSDWYLNDKRREDSVYGFYYDITRDKNDSYDKIAGKNLDYFIVTNEHDVHLNYDAGEIEHLEVIKDFRQIVNGKEFWTQIIKFNK